jgi:hypothetical protein
MHIVVITFIEQAQIAARNISNARFKFERERDARINAIPAKASTTE